SAAEATTTSKPSAAGAPIYRLDALNPTRRRRSVSRHPSPTGRGRTTDGRTASGHHQTQPGTGVLHGPGIGRAGRWPGSAGTRNRSPLPYTRRAPTPPPRRAYPTTIGSLLPHLQHL